MTMIPAVSVVIATRDRPASLARLLRCINDQDSAEFECIVVDDGSADETIDAYQELWPEFDDRFRLLLQPPELRLAAGPSAARNRGIDAARGEFIAFCDDNDIWIRSDHLSTAVAALRQHNGDMFFANLQTSENGTVSGPDFYATVRRTLTRKPVGPQLFELSRSERAAGLKHHFPHCDTLVTSRQLLHDTGLFWEKLKMAEDRNLAFRLLDRASKVLYRDVVVADHDRTAQAGICKAYTENETRQFIILAMLHAETAMRDRALRRVARGCRARMLVELAQTAREAGWPGQARELALQSLLLRPTAAGVRQFAGSAHSTGSPLLWRRRAETR